MRNGLLVVERMVLESLYKKKQNVMQLESDTGLDGGVLQNILSHFVMSNMVHYDKGIYTINKEKLLSQIKSLNKGEQVKEEVKELFTTMVNQYFRHVEKKESDVDIKVRKVWLTPSEEKIFNSYLINMETFIKNIEVDRRTNPRNEKLREKRIFIWGSSTYSSVARGCLRAV